MTQDQHKGVTILTVAGNLSGPEAVAVRDALRRINHGARGPGAKGGVVIDLDRCQFIDSEGLEALLAGVKNAEAHAVPLKLARLNSNCRLILELTRLEHRFDCCEDLASALKTMN